MLLQRTNAKAHSMDTEYSRKAFSCAADKGHEGVVQLLLERGDINPNTADPKYG